MQLSKMKLSPKQEAALRQLSEGEEYATYFFSKAKGLVWFAPLVARGYFGSDRNPAPRPGKDPNFYTIPHWSALDYLERVSEQCAHGEHRDVAEELLRIVREVTRPASGMPADNYRTWWFFTKILGNLPTDVVAIEDIDLVGDWLRSRFDTSLVAAEVGKTLLPRLLQSPDQADWQKAVRLLEALTMLREDSAEAGGGQRERRASVVDPYWLKKIFIRSSRALGQRCGDAAVEVLQRRLGEALNRGDDDEYSYIWRPAIEDHQQNHSANAGVDVFISALREVLLAYTETRPEEARAILRRLFASDVKVLRRIVLYVIGERFGLLGEIFWEVASANLFESVYQHEVFGLLKANFAKWSADQQDAVVAIVASLSRQWPEDIDARRFDAALRLPWLQAIQGQGHQGADALFKAYTEVVGRTDEHPDFASYSEGGFVAEASPVSPQDILRMSVSERRQTLGSFEPTNRWGGPTEQGLADSLKEAIKQQPEKFENSLETFHDAKVVYQLAVIEAFTELFKARKVFSVTAILKFCLSLVTTNEFWVAEQDASSGLQPRKSWIVSAIARFIRAGTENDESGFDTAALSLAHSLLEHVLERQPSTARGRDGDALTEAINTAKGTVLDTFFSYSLCRARRVGSDARQELWAEVGPRFETELAQCRGANFEFSALCGAYLPNLNYLNKSWLSANIDRIFPVTFEVNWRCALEGYAYVSQAYGDLYKLLRDHGHLRLALTRSFANSHVREKILQSIAVAYLEGLESLEGDESLFAIVLREGREKDLSHMIWFYWTQRKQRMKEGAVAAILGFWRKLDAQQRERQVPSILSDLTLLTSFLPDIDDEQARWLLLVAPFADERHHTTFFLEELARLVVKRPRTVGEVFLGMARVTYPTYKTQDIETILDTLYQRGERLIADEIANLYARHNLENVVGRIYERYHSRE